MLKASSLVYAIFICLLVSIMTGGLIYWAKLTKDLSLKNELKSELVAHCNSCFNYALASLKIPENTTYKALDLFDNGFKCNTSVSKWGLLNVLKTTSIVNNDSLSKLFFIGNKTTINKPALYMTDLSENLKISGTASIKGQLMLPKKGYEITNILGNQQINNPKIYGSVKTSKNTLPKITKLTFNKNSNKAVTLDDLAKEQITFNSFNNETIHIQLSNFEILSNFKLKGNFILHSAGTVNIQSNSEIEDVIIEAKSVTIASEFNGALQIFAKNEVIIEPNVTLTYPSSIVINNRITDEKKIEIGANTKILGGILMNTEQTTEIKNNIITLDKESLVIGDIYCNGILELKGDVIGSVYTNKFEYNTEYTSYSNLLLNTSIDKTALPDDFIHLPFFEESESLAYGTIKKIQ